MRGYYHYVEMIKYVIGSDFKNEIVNLNAFAKLNNSKLNCLWFGMRLLRNSDA